ELERVARAIRHAQLLADAVLGQMIRVAGGGGSGRIAIEIVCGCAGLQAHGLAFGVGDAVVRPGTGVLTRLEGAVHAVVGMRHLVVQHHHGGREGIHVEGRVVDDVDVATGAGATVHDVGVAAEGLGIAVLLVGQLLDRDHVAFDVGGLVELGEHLLPHRRGAQEVELGLDALHEAFRTLDLDGVAGVGVDGDVDHGRLAAGGRVDQVADLGVDRGIDAGAVHGVVAGTGIDGALAVARGDAVVADAAGQDVAGAGALDHVVAGAALDEVGAGAGGALVVAVAAVDDVDAFATGQQVVAAAAEDVVAAGAGEHGVVAFAAVDAVVAGTGGDGVVALAALDHDVDPDVGRDLDHVVAVARTDRQLLPPIE